MKTKILIYTEDVLEAAAKHNNARIPIAYPNGLHAGIAGAFPDDKYIVKRAGLDNIREAITEETLADTDVVMWWGHSRHDDVPDDIAALVAREVQKGLGLIVLHSGHLSKPFIRLVGTTGTLIWRHDDRERLWVTAPYHPIAKNVPPYFDLPNEEMYGEPFDIPPPEDIVFLGWFAGGEVFRSGLTYRRGYGRIFYFQPGHEEYPIYYNENIRLVLRNAVDWAVPEIRREVVDCPNINDPPEK
jgi:trehalose utilization protein